MKYMIMMFGEAATMLETQPKQWIVEMIDFMHQLSQDLSEAGELVAAEGLADGTQAKTVTYRDASTVVTDGPFAESKESVIGFWIVDVVGEERALEIATRVVDFTHGPIEVRQVMDAPPEVNADSGTEELLRVLAPQVLGALVRRYGHFDACEDAVQEALLAASQQWPEEGVADDPRAWLHTVASRRLVDTWRSDSARQRREETAATLEPSEPGEPSDQDDTLRLLFLCCHPSLSVPSQLALTLRAVGGLTTAEIAHAFLVPEATMAQRISRAKQTIRAAGLRFESPADADRAKRLGVVLHALYLVFNEGYLTTAGSAPHRADLTTEAIRLARLLHELVPEEGEVAGLLALLLLTDARRAARIDARGWLVPLAEQDRGLWNTAHIAEGIALVTRTLGKAPIGPYQLQAAIAAVHAEAATAPDTDWPQILALYGVLERVSPGPVITLNRAVAVAMVHGPRAGLAVLGTLDSDARMTRTHRLDAVRAYLLELAGDTSAARQAYQRAARRTASISEQRYLALRAAQLSDVRSEPHSH